ncbi:MAG: tRNA pseudouridine(55) synthase, partial [Bacteroidales bacterium]|nr:tRNA pseudouridine(55) synthase [Bacteroidales bacterium]
VCSKGTYIRALARDFGSALNSGAYLLSLRRTRIGPYLVKEALNMEQFEALLA